MFLSDTHLRQLLPPASSTTAAVFDEERARLLLPCARFGPRHDDVSEAVGSEHRLVVSPGLISRREERIHHFQQWVVEQRSEAADSRSAFAVHPEPGGVA